MQCTVLVGLGLMCWKTKEQRVFHICQKVTTIKWTSEDCLKEIRLCPLVHDCNHSCILLIDSKWWRIYSEIANQTARANVHWMKRCSVVFVVSPHRGHNILLSFEYLNTTADTGRILWHNFHKKINSLYGSFKCHNLSQKVSVNGVMECCDCCCCNMSWW